MNYSYEYSYAMEDEAGAAVLIFLLIYYLVAFAVGITSYVMGSLGLYAIAKRRGISNPWLSWIPVANTWIMGSISDQYRYVARGQIRNKRKILPILTGITVAAVAAVYITMMVQTMSLSMAGDAAAAGDVLGLALGVMGSILLILGLAIANAVFHYMAMYDLYVSANPSSSVALLVVSIFLNFLEPFFIFFNRKKDLGMPPRAEAVPVQPAYLPPQEPWTGGPEL